MVILAALAAFRAWVKGSGWAWFWLAAAAGTMVKGPLAVVVGAAGLLAAIWERRTNSPTPFRGYHFVGVLVFLLIVGGWFALAYRELGQALIDKVSHPGASASRAETVQYRNRNLRTDWRPLVAQTKTTPQANGVKTVERNREMCQSGLGEIIERTKP
jgi:4-amino-4-deoxy-L-arabinose transferase-like glycosyltransferase